MKWINKAHEYDGIGELLTRKWKKEKEVFIFGAGELGVQLRVIFERLGIFGGYIDNDEAKQKLGEGGYPVYSLKEFSKTYVSDTWIVTAMSCSHFLEVSRQLEEEGYELHRDYYDHIYFLDHVLPVLAVYCLDKLYMKQVEMCLTDKCSLKCEKCAHACYAVDVGKSDLELGDIYESVDTFFQYVDVVNEFALLGGEPFLYREIDSVIAYIGERYRERIIYFTVVTNGTILPSKEVLDVCRKYSVFIKISNYSIQVPQLKEKYQKLTKVLKGNGITYVLGEPETMWIDYGFDSVQRKYEPEELTRVFDLCGTPCRELRGKRLYYCVMARSVAENLHYNLGEEDFLDLTQLDNKTAKKTLMEFNYGYSEKGFLDMCMRCRGAEAYNYPIIAAKQLERKVY